MQRKPAYLPVELAALKYECAFFSLCARKYLNHSPPTEPHFHALARTQLSFCHFMENQASALVLWNQSEAFLVATRAPIPSGWFIPLSGDTSSRTPRMTLQRWVGLSINCGERLQKLSLCWMIHFKISRASLTRRLSDQSSQRNNKHSNHLKLVVVLRCSLGYHFIWNGTVLQKHLQLWLLRNRWFNNNSITT